MRRTVTLFGVFVFILTLAVNGFAQPRSLGGRSLILDDGSSRLITIGNLNRAVGIGTTSPDPSSILHLDGLGSSGVMPGYGSGVNSADGVGPRGVLLPRMTTAQRNDIESPANGLLIYNIDAGQFQYYNGGTFSWTPMATSGWSVLGNTIPAAGTGPGGNFIGTLNAQDFVIATNVGVAGSGAGERIRITSGGAVNILTSNAGTTAIGMTGANSSSTAINVGNTGNLLFNNLGTISAPFDFLGIHIGSNEVKRLGGGGVIAEQGITFNNEGGNFRFRLGGLTNADNPLLANRFVNLAGNSLFFTNSAGANLVQLNGASNAVNINTATAGNTSIGAAGSTNTITGTNNTITATATNQITGVTNNVNGTNNNLTATADNTLTAGDDNVLTAADDNTITAAAGSNILSSLDGTITVTGGDQTINVPGGASGNDLIFNGIDITNTNYDLLLINIGTNEVRRRATADLAEQGLIWQTEADGDSKVRLGVRQGVDANGTNALEQERTVFLGGFPLNFSQNDGNPFLIINDATNSVSIIPTIAGTTANIGNASAGDITITTDAATNSNDLVFNGLDIPQNDFDLLVINNLAPDINSVTRAAGPAVTEQGITFNNEGGETRIRHGSLTAGILPSDAPFEANRFENLNGFTYNITNSNAQGNDVFASFNGGTNAINFNTIDLGVVTIGNTTANRQLNVNGVVDAAVGSPFATTALWDQLVTGDLGVTGLVKIGNSVWIDANLPTAEFRSENPLDIETNGADNVTVTSNGDLRFEINGATGNVGIGLPASPISPLHVSANTGTMATAPAADGVHMGNDVANNHGISVIDNGGLPYIDFTNDLVNDYDGRILFDGGAAQPTFNFSTLNNNDMRWFTNNIERMELNGPNGNIGIGTPANGATERLIVFNPTGAPPSMAPGVSILTLGTVSGGATFRTGQVDGNRFWQQTYIPLTINELGQNVTIGTLAGGFGPSTNTLLGNNNIITSNDDITMTVGTDPGDELTLINIDAPTENIDVLVIHDQAAPNPNWVRRAEENTSQLTEQGITFNNEGGQNRIRLGSLTNGIDANTDAPFEADRFVNLVENELLFTGGAASTFNVLQLEGSSGVVNVMELSSQNAGNTIMKINGPGAFGIDIDPVLTGIAIDATVLGIDVGTGGVKPTTGINVQPATTGINIDGQASTVLGVNVEMSAPAVTTGGATAYNANIVGAGANNIWGTAIAVTSPGAGDAFGLDGAAMNSGSGDAFGLLADADILGGGAGTARGALITSTSGSGTSQGAVITASKSVAGLGTVTAGDFTATGNGIGTALGLAVTVSGSTNLNMGANITVTGINTVGIDLNHQNLGIQIDGGGTSIDADGSSLLGDNVGNDQLIVSTGTGPTTINTTANDVTINTDPASGTGNDLILNGIDQNPTSPFDIMVIQDAGNEVRRANSDGSNEITEQGITFNTEGGQTRIRLGDLAAGITVANAPFEADRFVNLVQNSLNFTGGAASTSNVMRIQGNNGGGLDQVSMTSLNATNTSVLKLNGPAVTGLDIDPVQFGIRIDATNTLIQQTGSITPTGIDMSGPGISGTGITIDDDNGVPSLTGLIVGGTNLALVGATVNASTGYVSTNSVTPTFTSFDGDGASYMGDNNGVDEFIVLADDGRIELNSANIATGIDITTTAAAGDGIDIVAQGAGEDVDIFGNQDITLTAFTNDIIGSAAENINLSTINQDINILSADEATLQGQNAVNVTSVNTTVTVTGNTSVFIEGVTNDVDIEAGDDLLVDIADDILANAGDAVTVTAANLLTLTSTNSDVVVNVGPIGEDLVLNGIGTRDDDTYDVLLIEDAGDANPNAVRRESGANLAEQGLVWQSEGGENKVRLGARTGVDPVGTNALELNRTVYLAENTLRFNDNNANPSSTLLSLDGAGGAASEGTVTVGWGNVSGTAQQRLIVNGFVNGAIGNTLALDPNVWDLVVRGDQVTTGIAKFGGSLWVDGVSANHAITSLGNDLDIYTTTGGDLDIYTGGAVAPLNIRTAGASSPIDISTGVNASSSIAMSTGGASAPIALSTAGQDGVISLATTGIDAHVRLQASHATADIYLTGLETRIGPAPEAAPTSTLQVAGSFAANVAAGGNIALNSTHHFYLVTAGAGSTITLPAAATCTGRMYIIKNNGASTNTLVQPAGGDNIDGAANFLMVAANAAIQIISDGNDWWITSTN